MLDGKIKSLHHAVEDVRQVIWESWKSSNWICIAMSRLKNWQTKLTSFMKILSQWGSFTSPFFCERLVGQYWSIKQWSCLCQALLFAFLDADQGLHNCSGVIISELGRMDLVLAQILLLSLELLWWSILKSLKPLESATTPVNQELLCAPSFSRCMLQAYGHWRWTEGSCFLFTDCKVAMIISICLWLLKQVSFLRVLPSPPLPPKIRPVTESHLETLLV